MHMLSIVPGIRFNIRGGGKLRHNNNNNNNKNNNNNNNSTMSCNKWYIVQFYGFASNDNK